MAWWKESESAHLSPKDHIVAPDLTRSKDPPAIQCDALMYDVEITGCSQLAGRKDGGLHVGGDLC